MPIEHHCFTDEELDLIISDDSLDRNGGEED